MTRKPRMPKRPQMPQVPQGRPNKKPGNYYYPYNWWWCDGWYYDDWYYDDWYYDGDYDYDWNYFESEMPRQPKQPIQPNQQMLQQAYKKGFNDGVKYASEQECPPPPEPTPPTTQE